MHKGDGSHNYRILEEIFKNFFLGGHRSFSIVKQEVVKHGNSL